jgi:signal transduction histidine kinase
MLFATLYTTYQIITFVIILFAAVLCTLFFSKLYCNKINRPKQLALLKAEFEQTVLLAQLEIQEQVLRNISQEIHDNIGQVLSLAKLNLNTIESKFTPEKIMLSEELLGKAIADLRNVSKSLFSKKITEMGLIHAVQNELNMIARISSLHTKLTAPANDPILTGEQAIILFRIIQETLNNIIKHAKATEIIVVMVEGIELLDITITDNGKGVDNKDPKNDNAAAGLKNIRSRAKLIDASIKINSQNSKGNCIEIQMPFRENI